MVVPAPYDWRPPTDESFQPDLVVVRREDVDLDDCLRATPLLAVEVLSPSNQAQDRFVKRLRYEALGVPAFWLVDPVEPSLSALRLDAGGRYVEAGTARADERFQADFPYPVQLAPADLLRL